MGIFRGTKYFSKSSFLFPSNSRSNGGGLYLNNWSFLIDIKINTPTNTYIPILSTDYLANKTAILTIKNDGSIGTNFHPIKKNFR